VVEHLVQVGLADILVVLQLAAFYGHVHLLSWARAFCGVCTMDVLMWAVKGGQLSVLEWLHSQGCPLDKASQFAAATGNVHVLKYLCRRGVLSVCDPYTITTAAANGHAHVLQWCEDYRVRYASTSPQDLE
jgi:hypothetical protein